MKELKSCTINEANYLIVARIPKALGRNRVSVHRFIEKQTKIQPAFTLNGYRYFSKAVLVKIVSGMRRKNGCSGNINGK